MTGLWKLLKTLAGPPEGLAADELGHWATRRLVLRALLTLIVAPVVIFVLWGVPALREAWAARYGPCATLIPRDEVAERFGVDIVAVRAWPRSDGCRAVFKVLAPAGYEQTVLSVAMDTERSAAWRLDILTSGTGKAVDTWDWDRTEEVHVVQQSAKEKVVLIGSAEPGYVELEVLAPTDAQVVALVQQVLASR